MPTQILRPNAAGDLTQFTHVIPGGTAHHLTVDETSADGETSMIRSQPEDASGAWFIVIKENSTTTAIEKTATGTFANYTNEFTAKPSDSSAFTVTDINNLQIGVKFTGDDNPINQTDLFNIEDWPHNSGDTINSITVTARWKSSGLSHFTFMDCTQIFATVDYTEFVETTGPFKIEAGANVKITSGKLTIK